MTKLSMLTIALASMAFLSACDSEEDIDDLRSATAYSSPCYSTPAPELEVRVLTPGGWEIAAETFGCVCLDHATGAAYNVFCGAGSESATGCAICCGKSGGEAAWGDPPPACDE